ncbi:MAG: HAD family phosphatase [Erysipelotrichaceae bacterium]|nr:HAD family phosphatase [Erysipelotrichaceae bacterium]MBQ7888432.1 HAD family phosphatase [Erysipelotrichaceae bacterium]
MKPIRVIFSDLDGTLFYGGPGKTQMTKENEEAIKRWTSLGHRFVIATGRPSSIRTELMQRYPIDCDILACNGAKVIFNHEVLWSKEIGPDYIQEIMDICEPYGESVDFALDMDWIEWVVLRRHGLIEENYGGAIFNTTVQQYIDVPREMYPNKIFMVCENQKVKQELMTLLTKRFEGRLEVTSSGQDNIELCCLGVGKDIALKEILQRLDLEETQAAAIGDEINDLGMLKCIPYGFAMNSARDEIKNQVSYTIDSVHELIDWCIVHNNEKKHSAYDK